jgi:cell division septation protein DedD
VTVSDDRQIPLPEPMERDEDDGFASTRRLLRNFVALIAVGGLVGIVWYAYEAGVSAGSNDGAVPVIRAEAGPIKEKVDPAGAGGIEVPFRDRKVYDLLEFGHEEAVKKTEAVARKPAAETDDGASESDAAEAGDEAADDKAAESKTAEAKAEDAQVAAAPPSGFRIQLAAVSSAEDVTRYWQKIKSGNMDLLGDVKLMVEKIDVPAKKQTLYRVQAGPFDSAKAAQEVCAPSWPRAR